MNQKFRIQQLLRMGVKPELLKHFGKRAVEQAVMDMGKGKRVKVDCDGFKEQRGTFQEQDDTQRNFEVNKQQGV